MSYTATRSRAADMLDRKGQTVTIAGDASATYDPATTGVTPTAYSATVKGVVVPLRRLGFSPYRVSADSGLAVGDEGLLLAGLDTAGAAVAQPPLGATVTLADGTAYTLVACEPLRPDGTNIIYDCAIRRARR